MRLSIVALTLVAATAACSYQERTTVQQPAPAATRTTTYGTPATGTTTVTTPAGSATTYATPAAPASATTVYTR
jgi:hypothetical protein